MFNLKGRVAVITGASSGLGRQMAKAFAKQGADLAILARRLDRLEELKVELEKEGVKVLAVQCDVTSTDNIRKSASTVEKFFGKEANKQINADEAVAYGAAVQAAIINNVEDDGLERLVLLDVTPLSLGTDVQEDIMSVIIPKNSTIPCSKTETYFTVVDDQTKMGIKIVQGERKFCKDNNLLGEFTLPLTTRGPAKSVKVDITLEVDINAILTVSAVEKGINGSEKSIKINNLKDRLTDKDIEKLIQEAKKYEANDLKRKNDLMSKTKLQDLAFEINKSKTKSTTAKKKAKEIIDWIKKNPDLDKEDYEKKFNELNKL
jgi:L1 cell adhesion molecule like protein